jgi:hypothetical protein
MYFVNLCPFTYGARDCTVLAPVIPQIVPCLTVKVAVITAKT